MLTNPQIKPSMVPVVTCASVCWWSIILLEPTAPASMIDRHSHHVGSNANISEKASSAPTTPPEAAEWVLILKRVLIIEHSTCMDSAPTMIPIMKWGMRIRSIT